MTLTRILSASAALLAMPALAHTGHGTTVATSFLEGILHPITGLDHLAMLLGTGFIAAQVKSAQKQQMIMLSALISLVAGMAVGALSGAFAAMETLILASVFIASFALMVQKHSKSVLAALVSVAMLAVHGWAHGVEAPAEGVTLFTFGMLLGAGGIVLTGRYVGSHVPAKWLSPALGSSALLLALAG